MFPEHLAASPLFRGLTAAEIQSACDCLSPLRRRYGKGAYILRAGDTVSSICVLARGAVHIVREDVWGDRRILQTIAPGELFGESYACLPERPLAVSAVAAADADVLLISARKLLRPCPNGCAFHARLIGNLVGILAGKNLFLTQKLDQVTQKTIRKKVMAYLSYEAVRQGGPFFRIPFDRQQLADYLAVDRSALSAELGRMREEGILSFQKNWFSLHGAEEERKFP